jgi:DNA-binding Xre family transcriptional regulator
MIHLTIREMMLQKGIKPSVYQLEKSGIGRVAARRYLHTEVKIIKLEDLYKLCLYFNCTPKELMRVVVDFDLKLMEKSPLINWTTPPMIFPIQNIRDFTPKQMERLQEAITEISGGV